MSRYMLWTCAVLVAALMLVANQPMATADSTTKSVTVKALKYATVTVDSSTGKIAKAAGSAVTNLDSEYIWPSEYQSVAFKVTCTQSISLVPNVQVSWDGGTTWVTKATPSIDVSSTQTVDGEALSLPVAPRMRVQLASHATYPVTYTACWLAYY